MLNQNLARGIFLVAIALFFASNAVRYSVGSLSAAGPGLFPLMVSTLLLLLGLVTMLQAYRAPTVPLSFNLRNIGLIILALVCFVVLAKYVNTLLGIVALVFVAGRAASSFSWMRSIQISVGLVVVAFLFERFLGLNLALFTWKF